MNTVIVITTDLIFKTKINTILDVDNLNIKNFNYFDLSNPEFLSNGKILYIIDLENENLDYSEIKNLSEQERSSLYFLGYCSHVRKDIMDYAIQSGFDEVLPRSKFVNILPDLVKNFDMENK